MKSSKILIALSLAGALAAGSAFAQTAAPAAPAAAAPAMAKTAKPRTAVSIACSGKADAQNVHGQKRKTFMKNCKAGKM